MKYAVKAILICLFLVSLVIAKGQQPPGEPPFGLKAQIDAKGTKLNGALFAEFINCQEEGDPPALICDARVVLRLRKAGSSELELFVDTILDVEPADVPATQDAIVAQMAPAILAAFLPGGSTVKVKSVTEFFYDSTNNVLLTDVQLAVS